MQFHWKKIGLSCIMHIHENKILPVKLATVRMECMAESTVVADDAETPTTALTTTAATAFVRHIKA